MPRAIALLCGLLLICVIPCPGCGLSLPLGGDGGPIFGPDDGADGTNGMMPDGNGTDDGDDVPHDDGDEDDGDDTPNDPDPGMTLTSRLLLDDTGRIDRRFARLVGCGGSNISPQLSWTNPTEETQSFLIVVFDQDANDFIHWVIFDIGPTILNINEGGPAPGGQALNDYGLLGWGGPCPPSDEEHTYVFRVYALDLPEAGFVAGEDVSLADVQMVIEGHVVGQAQFTATYLAQ